MAGISKSNEAGWIKTSIYLRLAKLKARYELQKLGKGIGKIVEGRYKATRERKRRLWEQYKFIPAKHSALYSKHAMVRTEGCGCELCKAIHVYANANISLHRFKKSFYSDHEVDVFTGRRFPIKDNFSLLYAEHTVKVQKENRLTQYEFFKEEYGRRKVEVKKLRAKYKAMHEAIQTILSSK